MASPRKSGDERLVSRTYRAAIRLGEDFITLEETITLPLDASAEEVTQAVDLGWRIYRAQREAAEAQAADIRSTAPAPAPITIRDPDAPASDNQRNYIATLQDKLTWSSEQPNSEPARAPGRPNGPGEPTNVEAPSGPFLVSRTGDAG